MPSQTKGSLRTCSRCGFEAPRIALYCRFCGSELLQSVAESQMLTLLSWLAQYCNGEKGHSRQVRELSCEKGVPNGPRYCMGCAMLLIVEGSNPVFPPRQMGVA